MIKQTLKFHFLLLLVLICSSCYKTVDDFGTKEAVGLEGWERLYWSDVIKNDIAYFTFPIDDYIKDTSLILLSRNKIYSYDYDTTVTLIVDFELYGYEELTNIHKTESGEFFLWGNDAFFKYSDNTITDINPYYYNNNGYKYTLGAFYSIVFDDFGLIWFINYDDIYRQKELGSDEFEEVNLDLRIAGADSDYDDGPHRLYYFESTMYIMNDEYDLFKYKDYILSEESLPEHIKESMDEPYWYDISFNLIGNNGNIYFYYTNYRDNHFCIFKENGSSYWEAYLYEINYETIYNLSFDNDGNGLVYDKSGVYKYSITKYEDIIEDFGLYCQDDFGIILETKKQDILILGESAIYKYNQPNNK